MRITVMNGWISGIGMLYAVNIPSEVTTAASNNDIPVPTAALRMEGCTASKFPNPVGDVN